MRILHFAALIYIPAWCACPAVSDAPVNDLDVCRRMKEYAHKVVSHTTLKKLRVSTRLRNGSTFTVFQQGI